MSSMKIIKVAGCSNCPHGALWDIDTRKYMCGKLFKLNNNVPPYPPEWCPLEDAIEFIKELAKRQPTRQSVQSEHNKRKREEICPQCNGEGWYPEEGDCGPIQVQCEYCQATGKRRRIKSGFEEKMDERCEACTLKYQCANVQGFPPCALEPEPWNKISNHPKVSDHPTEDVPLLLSDGDSIYSGFYGKFILKRKYHAWGTNAKIRYWKYAPKPPNSQEEDSYFTRGGMIERLQKRVAQNSTSNSSTNKERAQSLSRALYNAFAYRLGPDELEQAKSEFYKFVGEHFTSKKNESDVIANIINEMKSFLPKMNSYDEWHVYSDIAKWVGQLTPVS